MEGQLSMAPGCTALTLTVLIHHDYGKVSCWLKVSQGPASDDLTEYSEHQCGESTPQQWPDAVSPGVVALRVATVDACEPFSPTYLELADTIRASLHSWTRGTSIAR